MKKIIFIAAIGLSIAGVYAQAPVTGTAAKNAPIINTLKIPIDKSKQLVLTTSNVSVDVEGYDGDDLVIEANTNKQRVTPPEADGLVRIKLDNRAAADNTISYKLIADTKDTYQIDLSAKCGYLHLKVPNHLSFSIDADNMSLGAYLSIKNFTGPFKATGIIGTINISNVSGLFGVIGRGEKVILSNILWKQDAPGPYPYGISSTGDIDITIPADMKATITNFPGPASGQIYSDLDLASLSNDGSKMGILKVNGGGVGIFLYNTNRIKGNTYIRKQQK